MLSKEDLQQLSSIFDEKLDPINKRLDKIDERLEKVDERLGKVDERLDNLEEDMKEVKGMVNILSQWAEAATEYHIHEIHYPLEDDEIVR